MCVCFFFLTWFESFFVSHFEFVIHLYSEFSAKNFTYNIVSILYSPLPPASCITLLVSLQLLGIYLCSLQLFCWFFCLLVFYILFTLASLGLSLLRQAPLSLRGASAALGMKCGLLAGAASLVRARGLWSTRASVAAALGLRSVSPEVSVQGLRCSAACGVFPDQALNPRLLLSRRLLTSEPPLWKLLFCRYE